MNMILAFLLKSILVSGLLFLYYLLFLRDKKLYTYNRFYLLCIVGLSIAVPFLHFDWYQVNTQKTGTTYTILNVISTGEEEAIIPTAKHGLSIEQICGYTYVLITLGLLMLFIIRIAWVYTVKRKHPKESRNGIVLIHTKLDKAPFSFFNNLFWKETIAIDSKEGQQILQHEYVHIYERHTVDKLFMQLVLIMGWINPVYWLIQKELSLVHEFIADEKAIEGSDTASFAAMLLHSQYGNAFPDITHPFFYSPIKRRLIMLTTSNKTSYSYLRRLLVLPLLGITVFLFSFSLKKNISISRAEKKIVMVLDAGHGGKDNGITGANGMQEKDLTLKIANKMSELAKAYNIDVVLTRKGDDYPTLDARAHMVKENAANLLVSIHINDEHGVTNGNGYEIIVDSKSPQYAESKKLASAIAADLNLIHIQPRLVEKGLWVLKKSEVPAVLVECGYINNAKEMEVLQSDAQLEKLCSSILNGVVNYKNSK